jgi:hypothetical protein
MLINDIVVANLSPQEAIPGGGIGMVRISAIVGVVLGIIIGAARSSALAWADHRR